MRLKIWLYNSFPSHPIKARLCEEAISIMQAWNAERRSNLPDITRDDEQQDLGKWVATIQQIATGFASFGR